jgi:putative transposase
VYIHLVFSTKNRRPFLGGSAFRARLHSELGGISKALECAPFLTGGVEDHVHHLVRFGRIISQAEWVKELKRASSIWVKEQDCRLADFELQAGYATFSVSPSNLDQVKAYIANQEEHHRQMSFQDELRAMLERHGMDWDERYVWD